MSEWTTTCPDCGAGFTELSADTSSPRFVAVRCASGHEHAVAEAVRHGDEVRFRLAAGPPLGCAATTMTAALPGANIWRRP